MDGAWAVPEIKIPLLFLLTKAFKIYLNTVIVLKHVFAKKESCQSRKWGIPETSKIFWINHVNLVFKQGSLNISPFMVTPDGDAGQGLPPLRLFSRCAFLSHHSLCSSSWCGITWKAEHNYEYSSIVPYSLERLRTYAHVMSSRITWDSGIPYTWLYVNHWSPVLHKLLPSVPQSALCCSCLYTSCCLPCVYS